MADPTDADGQALRDWLASRGATQEQIDWATPGRIDRVRGGHGASFLAAQLVLTEGATLSAHDLADRSGLDLAAIIRGYRNLGVAVPDPHAAQFTEADLEFVSSYKHLAMPELAADEDLDRVVAAAHERIAEAAVALYVQGPERDMVQRGVDPVTEAEKAEQATRMALDFAKAFGALFRHHMRQAIARQQVARAGVIRPELARLAIGFVDLAGSTAIEANLDPEKLAAMVSFFEARAFDVVADGGGRLVKFIGDEIMVAAPDPVAGCRIVQALVATFADDGLRPRGGLVYGEVLFRHGDYYGPVVNLAARLVQEAIPGEVLVDGSILDATATASDVERPRFEPAGRRLLKGFDDPVRVWTLTAP
jgi:adenylate cyclase